MVIYLNVNGTAEKVTPEHVYQGSNNVTDITVIAPYPNTCAMEIGFILPNDLYWEAPSTEEGKYGGNYAPMESVTDYDTVSANAWNFVLPDTVTQMPGRVGVAIKATTAQGERTSYLCEFFVEESVLPILPANAPKPDVYQLILQYLGRLNGRTANVPNLVARIDKSAGNSFTYTDNKGIISAPITFGEIEYDPTYVTPASVITIPKSAWQQVETGSGYTALVTAGQHGQMVDGVNANDLWLSFDEIRNGVISGDPASYSVDTTGDITITVAEPVDMTVRVWNGKGLIDQVARENLQAETERAKAEETSLYNSILAEQTRAESIEAELQAEIDQIEQSGVDLTARAQIDAEKERAKNAEAQLQANIIAEQTRSEAAEEALQADIDDINIKIPAGASSTNQLADKAFVNSTVNNMSAFYITYTQGSATEMGQAFPTQSSLLNATTFYSGTQVRVPTQNDYATVLADETQPKGADGSYPTTRYLYQTNEVGGTYPNGQWAFQYVVNNTSLTQAQVNAINSGITETLVEQIAINTNNIATRASKDVATQTTNGLMSATDKTKLDGLSTSGVTGVKGAEETSYRTGNVNITAANVGALPTSGGVMRGVINFNISSLTSTPQTLLHATPVPWDLPILRFKANSNSNGYACLCSNGLVAISSGNSYSVYEANGSLSDSDAIITSDYNVKVYTNLANGWDNKRLFTFNLNGGLILNVVGNAYNEGVRVNADEGCYAGIYLGNDRGTVSGVNTTKGWIIARANGTIDPSFPLIFAAQGSQTTDSSRVRIERDGSIYMKGKPVISATGATGEHLMGGSNPTWGNAATVFTIYESTAVSTGDKSLKSTIKTCKELGYTYAYIEVGSNTSEHSVSLVSLNEIGYKNILFNCSSGSTARYIKFYLNGDTATKITISGVENISLFYLSVVKI